MRLQGKTTLHMATMMGRQSNAEALIAHTAQARAADMQVIMTSQLIQSLLLAMHSQLPVRTYLLHSCPYFLHILTAVQIHN